MQAYVHLLAATHSIGALHSVCAQLKRAQLSVDRQLLDGNSGMQLQRMLTHVWQTTMRQLQYRLSCLQSSLLQARVMWQGLVSRDPAEHRCRAQCADLAQRVAAGNAHAAHALEAGMRRRMLRECTCSADILASAASALLAGTHRAAKYVHDSPWRSVASDADAAQLSQMQATLLALLAQCASARCQTWVTMDSVSSSHTRSSHRVHIHAWSTCSLARAMRRASSYIQVPDMVVPCRLHGVQGNFERPQSLMSFQDLPPRTILACASEVIAHLRSTHHAKHVRRPLQLPDALLGKLQVAVAGGGAAAGLADVPAAAVPGATTGSGSMMQDPTAAPPADTVVRQSADGALAEGEESSVQVGVRRKRR